LKEKTIETPLFDLRWPNYVENLRIFQNEEKEFENKTKKLTGKSALMQLGFFTGYFIAAIFFYTHTNEILYTFINNTFIDIIGCKPSSFCNFIEFIFPAYNNIGAFGSMSLEIGIFGLIIFIFYRSWIPESAHWKMWKVMYTERNKVLKEQQDLLKQKEMKDSVEKSEIKKRILLLEKQNLEPGIKKLLDNTNNEKYRDRVIGFWLILSGLMYMYYSTVVVIPEILSRDNILIESSNPSHQIVTLIILLMSLIAHFIVGVILYNRWDKESRIKNKIIFPLFKKFENFRKTSYNGLLRAFGANSDVNKGDNNKHTSDPKYHDLDIVTIEVIGSLLIIIGIINSIIFYQILKGDNTDYGLVIIIFTALATLVANSGWAIVPSMLASRFPTHFRSTGSSLAYNGGLVISFASPFIIMEFFLGIKSEYMIFIAMIMGAISMIIGAKRLMHQKTDNL